MLVKDTKVWDGEASTVEDAQDGEIELDFTSARLDCVSHVPLPESSNLHCEPALIRRSGKRRHFDGWLPVAKTSLRRLAAPLDTLKNDDNDQEAAARSKPRAPLCAM